MCKILRIKCASYCLWVQIIVAYMNRAGDGLGEGLSKDGGGVDNRSLPWRMQRFLSFLLYHMKLHELWREHSSD